MVIGELKMVETESLTRKEMNEDARTTIRSELSRAFLEHKRVRIGVLVAGSGKYTIEGFIDVLGPFSCVVECDGEDGKYKEIFSVRDVRIVMVFE